MTLIKEKPRRPSTTHRKRYGHHHRQSHSYLKTYWPYMPIVSVVIIGIIVNSWLGQAHRSVLGYATDMSVQELLDGTNTQRADNGEAALAINAELDQAAQVKANDMAARNYWSHNTPDGQTPWSFITAAGYEYQTAGENLAYGFTSAGDTISGWMNSPEHRANILNTSYKDVGFGIVNIADYQNTGPETLVVAMYASPVRPAVAAATPTPAVPRRVVSTPVPAPAPVATPPATTPVAVTQPSSKAAPAPKPTSQAVAQPAEQRIDRLQLVAATVPISSAALLLFGAVAAIFILVRHGMAWHKFLRRSEALVLHHPVLDVIAVSLATLSVLLTHTVGYIR